MPSHSERVRRNYMTVESSGLSSDPSRMRHALHVTVTIDNIALSNYAPQSAQRLAAVEAYDTVMRTDLFRRDGRRFKK